MTIEAKLRVTPDMAAALAALKRLTGSVADLGTTVKKADGEATFTKTRRGLESVSQQLSVVRQQVLALFGLQQGAAGIAGIARMSDEYQGLNARLRIATGSQKEFNSALSTAKNLAQQYNQPLRETAVLLTRSISALKPLGGGVREAAAATESLVAALKITGASSAESGSAILQFSQALGSGILRGEEFNAINEAAPRLLDALASGLGKPRSELKALAEQGQLTTNAVVTALSKELPKLRAEAASIPATIGGAYQQLTDALTQYIGKQTEANGSSIGAANVLKLLAENINLVLGALQALLAIGLAVWLGRGVAALVLMSTATTTTAGSVGFLAAAMRGLLALIGGPVGLAVAVGSLALAWLGLANAKQAARKRTELDAQNELADVNLELALARAQAKRAGSGASSQIGNEIFLLDEKRKRLQAELSDYEAQRNGAFRGQRSEGTNSLADPASIKKFQEEYKLRGDLVKKFAEENAAYVKAKDIEINQARASGDLKAVRDLEASKSAYLKQARRKQNEELKSFDTEGALSRLATVKALYASDVELVIDAAKREQQALQQRFDQGLIDLQAYLAQKAQLLNTESDAEIGKLKTQLAEEKRVRDANSSRPAKDANAREAQQESLLASNQKINELTTQIAIKERDRLTNAQQLTLEAEKLTRELVAQQKATETQIKQALGKESREDIARRLQDQFQPQLNREVQLGGDGTLTQRLIDITVLREVLSQARAEMDRTLTSLKLDEDALRQQQEAGLITQRELEQRIYNLRQASLPLLQQQAAEIERLAAPLGEQERLTARQAASSAKAIEAQRSPLQQLEQQTRDTAANGFGTLFSDIVSGAKTADEAMRDFVGNIAKYVLDLVAKRLGQQLAESLLPSGSISGGGGGGIGSLFSTIFSLFGFHSGGVVRPGGQTFTRSIPAGLAMAAAQYAPRYHTGGIAGFKPNERLAVLEEGEEVLTADNPRHVANYRAGGNGVMVNSKVVINGAKGDAQKQERAGNDLQQQINTVIDQWALREKRPGGLLAN